MFRVRVDIADAEPAIWRRLDVAGDVPLPRVHVLLQAAFGWFDQHLHSFTPLGDGAGLEGRGRPLANPGTQDFSAENLPPEHEIRLDQVVAKVGDRLLYEYDFGDSWEHVIVVEAVSPRSESDPPARLFDGRRAGPPEDCGGIPMYNDLVAALEGRPTTFHDNQSLAEHLDWLPEDFDPAEAPIDGIDLEELLDVIDRAESVADHLVDNPRFAPIVRELIGRVEESGMLPAFAVLITDAGLDLTAEPVGAARAAVVEGLTREEAAQITRPWTLLLELLGPDGVTLTGAGYLPPAIVEGLFTGLDMGQRWIGKGNREDQTPAVAALREAATALGLVRKTKGKLVPTKAALAASDDAVRLWHVVADGLTRVRRDFPRDATAMALLCLAGEQPLSLSLEAMGVGLLGSLGWSSGNMPIEAQDVRWMSETVWTVMAYGGLDGEDGSTPAGRRLARAALLVP